MKVRQARDERRRLRQRLWLVGMAFALGFAVLVARAADLQLLQGQALTERARREFIKHVKIPPRRGIIYDRHQEELAVSLDTYSVYASPLKITTPRQTGYRLAKALGQPGKRVSARLAGERGFAWVARRISPDRAEAVKALDLEGVGLLKEPRRFYPYSQLACHVLGFAGLDARGLEGLEARYDRELKGPVQSVVSLRDALGRKIHLTTEPFTRLPEGRHLMLTLDKTVQYAAEKALTAAVEKFKAQAGQAIVIIPSTGEILAMASVPAFNPNIFSRYPKASFRNRCVTDAFEPGSTFKIFVAGAALQTGKVSLDQLFDCENGQLRVGRYVIHDTHAYDRLNLAEIVQKSSNIGAAKVGMAVGAEELYQAFRDFGFGRPTGVELPGEGDGILRAARGWQPVDLANICFGQGVAVTPLQLITAVAAIANGGVLMRPHVVRAVMEPDASLVRETQPQVVRRVLGVREARILTRMMVGVTQEGGTGTQARLEPWEVAGKTGTAQKVDPKGGYSQRDYMASFVGFVPADDPQVAVLVVIDTPRGQTYGGLVAAPAWAEIARAALASLGVHPDEGGPVMAGQPAQEGLAPAAIAAASPQVAARDLARGVAPDLTGLTLRQVLRLAKRAGQGVAASGWGRVAGQSPAPGRPLTGDLSIRLQPSMGGA